jgi:hypothetical protein
MTKGEKWFAIVATCVVAVIMGIITFVVSSNTIAWNNSAATCQARGGNLTTIDGNPACVQINMTVVPK